MVSTVLNSCPNCKFGQPQLLSPPDNPVKRYKCKNCGHIWEATNVNSEQQATEKGQFKTINSSQPGVQQTQGAKDQSMTTVSPQPSDSQTQGAIVYIDPTSARTGSVFFQFNPATVSRSIVPQWTNHTSADQGSPGLSFAGAPIQTIDMDIDFDASDDIKRGKPTVLAMGIFPKLAALEQLVYPHAQDVIDRKSLKAPLTILALGPNRVVPIQLTRIAVTETSFDTNLNPIKARVSLSMRVLSYSDLDPSHKGYHLFLAYLKDQETMSYSYISGQIPPWMKYV